LRGLAYGLYPRARLEIWKLFMSFMREERQNFVAHCCAREASVIGVFVRGYIVLPNWFSETTCNPVMIE
jgi:hypothetical protein